MNILIAGGAISANFIVIFSLIEPRDTVICVHPTYQQLYSIPAAFGAKVKLLKLKKENKWILDINELESLVDEKTKMIIINNPNNPTGSLTRNGHLKEICRIAENVGAYIFSDESYRGIYINPDDQVPSIAELSQNGISTGSFSKPFSLTGLRLGWIAAKNSIIKECEKRRDYTTISNAMIDDALATLAVENVNVIHERNQNIVDRNFRILSSWVNNEPLIEWIPPEAGSVAFLHHKLPIDSEELCKLLLDKEDVLLVPGSCFDMDNYLRIGWGGNSETLKEGLRRFKNFLNGYRDYAHEKGI